MQGAIDEAGLESPFPTQTTNLQIDPATVGLIKELSSENGPDEPLSS